MAVLFVSGVQADRTFVMRLAQELADVVDAVQVGEHPQTTPPPPNQKANASYSAVVAVISPASLPNLPALKTYCDATGLALVPVSRYPPTDPIPELGRHAIYFRDAYYTEAFLKLVDELREAKVRVYLQGQRSKDHWSPLEEIKVPNMSPRVMIGMVLRGGVVVALLIGARYGYIRAVDEFEKNNSPTSTPGFYRSPPPSVTPTATHIPETVFTDGTADDGSG
ncbi:MAG: hypothetical protein K8L91_01360 [Anaerolineae bacterium]|nr:hypothetical protein [Anaerolineae bacterium]